MKFDLIDVGGKVILNPAYLVSISFHQRWFWFGGRVAVIRMANGFIHVFRGQDALDIRAYFAARPQTAQG